MKKKLSAELARLDIEHGHEWRGKSKNSSVASGLD
jgi:hypothetical protein